VALSRLLPADLICFVRVKNVDATGLTYTCPELVLENGVRLQQVPVRYKTFGTLNAARSNCLVVCHALTGNASLDDWWGDMLGKDKLFDTSRMFVVCANILGSCYGTCGPTSVEPGTGKPYGIRFPDVTIRDSVALHMRLVREHLGVRRVACVVGGSLGGMQTLEWAVLGGDFVGAIIPMCCGAFHHPWQIGISEAQRMAIYADPNWAGGEYLNRGGAPPMAGLAVARAAAMITYRSHSGYSRKFGRHVVASKAKAGAGKPGAAGAGAGHGQERFFQVENYLRHQGQKFVRRFDPHSYVKVTRMMDSHDLGRGREGGSEAVLAAILQPCLIISVKSDVLYPPLEQEYLKQHIRHSKLFSVDSDHGHDGFLLDQDAIMPVALQFLRRYVYRTLDKEGAASL
jgi:homoserine O-acetyltransferase